MESVTICLINQKGGCGKSSTVFHLAGSLIAAGHSVLLVDADPQGSLSQGFLGSAFVEGMDASQTLAALFNDSKYFLSRDELVRPTPIDGITIVPANQHLAEFNAPKPELTGITQFTIRDFLSHLERPFDFVLIDCPPNLYQCSWNAMLASDQVLIPVPPEDFGTQGLRAVHQAIDHARRLNPKLRRLGHLVTRYDRRLVIHRRYQAHLRVVYDEMVMETSIPELSAFKVAIACRQPVEQYSSKSAAANAMRLLVVEIKNRLASLPRRRMVG